MTIVTTDYLLDTTQSLLTGATAAGGNVFLPGDWPTWDKSYPYIRIRPGRERRESQGNGGINFEVVSVIRVTGRVSAPAELGDAGASAAEVAAWALKRQIEVAVINAYTLKALTLSEFPFVDSEIDVTSEGRIHYGEVVMDIAMAFYQGVEAFAQPTVVPLDLFTATQTGPTPGPGVSINLSSSEE